MLRAVIFSFLFVVQSIYASGEFSVLFSPSSLEFKGNDKLYSEFVGDVLAASLGRSVPENSYWNSLYVKDVFNLPKSVIALYIDGVQHIHTRGKAKNFALVGNAAQQSLNLIASDLEESNALVIDADISQGIETLLTYSDILGDISVQSPAKNITPNLKPDLHSEDKLFLQQIAVLNVLANNLPFLERRPSLMTIRLSLSPITSVHGEKSPAMVEAQKLLADATEKLALSAEKAYKDDILFVTITNNAEIYRTKRETEPNKEKSNPLNLAVYYSEDYPVIFNIILWFGVIFAFTLLAISYAIATMDPGRDSIIYRMTSTRMKKDN